MKKPSSLSIAQIAKKSGNPPKNVSKLLEFIKGGMIPCTKIINVTENEDLRYYQVERRGIGILNTEFGKFWEYDFAINDYWEKYSVIVKVDQIDENYKPMFKNKKRLVLRTDSGCETGQLFEDLTCDCRDQLRLAMKTLQDVGEGMIVNIPHQDGRGMGLSFKLATLWLQDAFDVDTVESANLLAPGGVIDVRTYAGVICVLKFFGIENDCKIELATNNPKKLLVFRENGYAVSNTSVVVPPTEHTFRHLLAKETHLGHINLVGKKFDFIFNGSAHENGT